MINDSSGLVIDEIFDDVFCFYGVMSPEGFLLSLKGKTFDEAPLEPHLFTGQKFSETVFWQANPHVAALFQNAVDKASANQKSKTLIEFRVSAKKNIFVEINLVPRTNDKGTVTQIPFFAFDVTERENEIRFYKQRSEQFLFAAEAANVGLWFWDLSGEEIITSPRCNEIYQISPHEIVTVESFFKSLHPEDASRVMEEIREAQVNNKEFFSEYRVIYSNGSVQWLAARGKALYDEENVPIQMMGIVRRITEKKLADAESNLLHDKEKQALDAAEEAIKAKDYFIAFVSHELRSPLNSILGWVKILLTRQVDEPTRKNALETIERSAKTQAKLIEDLVDSARITSGKLRLDLIPLNLYEVANNTFQSHLPIAQAKNVNLRFDSDTTNAEVYGDPMRLQQVFTNLLTNALKFTPQNGDITIKMTANSNSVEVSFQDSGQGISPEFLPRIFNQFTQAEDTATRDRTGLGLGLTIVKTLVEKQNGSVRAESEGIGKGARFIVTFSLLPNQNQDSLDVPTTSKERRRELKGLKILVVEDDVDSREVLKLFLEQSGAEVQSVESSTDALLMLRRKGFTPNVIVSDIGMPVEDGYSFMKKVRKLAEPAVNKIPAIALSAFASSDNKKKAYSAGFQKYHTKPFEPDLLIEEITELTK